jgi:ribosomal-protein-alanine N-acetyltransferase
MIHTGKHVHRHLDWRDPVSWIGSPPFLVMEEGSQILAALACPPDPPGIAWLRLFVQNGNDPGNDAWKELWGAAQHELACHPGTTAAAIVLEEWILPILKGSGFQPHQQIVMLECSFQEPPGNPIRTGFSIRPMFTYDLQAVTDVDASAFDLLWQNSHSALSSAYRQAMLASVVELNEELVAYQISTRSALGIHLARLAVRPGLQGRGVGQALVEDLMSQAARRGIFHLSVNTQSDNAASLALYKKNGFIETGTCYPVYQLQIT